MPTYTKPYLSPPRQLNLLKSRGLQVNNEADAIAALVRNGYYRLSAYWFPFRKVVNTVPTDIFLNNSFFEDAIALYRFDKDLKILMMDVIERVEIAIRVQIALLLGQRNKFAHEDKNCFNHHFVNTIVSPQGETAYDIWLARFESMLDRSSEEFVTHHKNKYGRGASLPIWIAIELWDFGMTSKLFAGMTGKDQNRIARTFKVANGNVLKSWLRSINYIRNIIAHHGRLWNRSLVDTPNMPNRGDMPDFDVLRQYPNSNKKLYYTCCILAHLSDSINSTSNWKTRFKSHIQHFPNMPHARVSDMGFPPGWDLQSFWI